MKIEGLVDDRAMTLFAGYRLIPVPLDGTKGGILGNLTEPEPEPEPEEGAGESSRVFAIGVYDQGRNHLQVLLEAPLGESRSIGLDYLVGAVLRREDEEVNQVECSQIRDPELGLTCGRCARIDVRVYSDTPVACPTCDRPRRFVTVMTSPWTPVDKAQEMKAVRAAVDSPDCGMGVDAGPVTTPTGPGCDGDPDGARTI